MTDKLNQSIAELRKLCNEEIQRITQDAYRPRPKAEVINPDVPVRRVNDLLKACDKVFAATDRP